MDIDKCLDGWVSLSRKENLSLDTMTEIYRNQGMTDDFYKEAREKMTAFLRKCLGKDVRVVLWTANNEHNTIVRFLHYWKIPRDVLSMLGLVCGRKDGVDTPKHLLVQPYIDAGYPTIGALGLLN